jgi:hypothetical protein
LKQKQAHRRRRMMIPASTPMTIPAMAPPLRPPPEDDAWTPIRELPSVPTGGMKGTVAVAVPVEMTVTPVLLVGLRGGFAVAAGNPLLELPSSTHLLVLGSQLCPTVQQELLPHCDSPSDTWHVTRFPDVGLGRRLLHVEVMVVRSVCTYVVVNTWYWPPPFVCAAAPAWHTASLFAFVEHTWPAVQQAWL